MGVRHWRFAILVMAAIFAPHQGRADEAKRYFVLIYSRGPAWKPDLPMKDQSLGAHVRYMKELRDGKILFAAGPLDTDGGLIIAKAADQEEAAAIMARDPAIQAGIFVGQFHSWAAAFEAGSAPAAFLSTP